MIAVAAMAVLLVASIAPVTAATSRSGRGFDGTTKVAKHLLGRTHVASQAAVARAHPRPLAPAIRHPRLKADFGLRTEAPNRARTPSTAILPNVVTLPDVAQLATMPGMAEVEAGTWTPADPWVAASGGYVVQVVNSMVRAWNRTGSALVSIPTEAFFNIPPAHTPADSRIIWDATHSRWVGEVVWFVNDLSDNGFTLAVSDGPDPTAGWSLITIGYGAFLPDYPSLASSNDKIVVADDVYDSLGTFQSADINTFTWASILGSGGLTFNYCDDSGFAHPRAAQVLSPSNDVHLIMEATDGSGDQWYFRLIGAGVCTSPTFQIIDGENLAGLLMPGIQVPPPPRQVGGDTIDDATDGRATDAVWQNGHLWWVSTLPASWDGGATFNDSVEVYTVDTLSAGPPVASYRRGIVASDGIDVYMAGIGLTRSGTPIVTYSQSSSTTPVSLFATRIDPLFEFGTPLLLATGDGPIASERWGDYAGVAMDPIGTGTVWATHMVAAGDGTWRTTVARLAVDNDLPTTPSAPSVTTYSPTNLTLAPKYRIGWGTATDAGTGTVTYRLEQSFDGGGFVLVGTYSSTAAIRSMWTGHTYQFRISAMDALGKIGATATGPLLHPATAQFPTSRTGTWGTTTNIAYSGNSTLYASAAGATATYSSTGVRSLAFVTTKSPGRGSFRVYIDGVLKATISAYSTTTLFRQVVYQYSWSTPGTHSIKIYVLGTAGHPRVDVDAFLVLK